MAIADLFTDRLLKNPTGPIARLWWRDMKAHHKIFRDTLDALAPTPGDNLLEIGCGGGTFIHWVLESGCRATAVDRSADMVELTKKNNATAIQANRLEVVQASAEALPLPDDRYTGAALMNAFFFLDAQQTLAELRRVLAPGARLILHTVAPDPPASVAPRPVTRRMRLYTDTELLTLVEEADFTEPHLTRVGGVFQLLTATRPSSVASY